MGMKMQVELECGTCGSLSYVWMKLYEDQPGTSKEVRELGWKNTYEKGLVCPDCFEAIKGEVSLVPRGL